MHVFITRAYSAGDEMDTSRVYATLEGAQHYLESCWPDAKVKWREAFVNRWFARPTPGYRGDAVYVDRVQVLEDGEEPESDS